MRKLSLLLICCLVGHSGYPQQFPVLKYSTKEGLGHPVVYRMFQDHNKMLWFSTDNGLTRYDGFTFKNYTINEGLFSNYIFSLDTFQNKTAICTYGGGIQFLKDGRFLNNTVTPAVKYPIDLVSYKNKLFIIDKNTFCFVFDGNLSDKPNNPDVLEEDFISKLLVFNNQLYGMGYGIWQYDDVKNYFIPAEKFAALRTTGIYNAILLKNNGLLLTTGKGLLFVNNDTEIKVIDNTLFSSNTGNMLQLQNGEVLISYPNGKLVLYDENLGNKRNILEGVIINDIKQDYLGNIWLCTYGKGVWKIPSLNIAFHPMEDLQAPFIGGINAESKTVDINSLNGHNYHIRYKNQADSELRVISQREDKGYSGVFYANGKPEYYYSSNGIYKNGVLIKRAGSTISKIFKDKKQTYWAGAKPGLYSGASIADLQPHKEFDKLIIRTITENDSGNVFIGTDSGMFVLNKSQKQYYGKEQGLEELFVRKLVFDKQQNRVWIGTADGLYVMQNNVIKKRIDYIGVNDIKIDAENHLWIACSWGLLHYNQKKFRVFSEQEGLQTNIQELEIDETDNTLHLLSTDKYFKVNFNYLLQDNRAIPQIVIDKQLINDSLYSGVINNFEKPINKLQIYFSVPQLNNNYGLKLKYRVNGSDWVKLDWASSISATGLGYGNNEIEINLYDDINQQALHSIKLLYKVKIPFWRKPAFLVISFIILVGITVAIALAISKYYQKKKIEKLIAQQHKLTLEHKVLSNMLNPHFLNNALNSIQAFVVKNDQRKTLNYLSRFARLMRVNLELLDKDVVSLDKELKNVALYVEFEQIRNQDLILFSIIIDEAIDTSAITLPSLSLQPFVENAIWHGILPLKKQGTIQVFVKQSVQEYIITIEDDGIGYTHSLQNKKTDLIEKESRGIQIIKDRFRLLNQVKAGHHFEISNREPNGTIVSFRIPK
jgi:Histidine kinase